MGANHDLKSVIVFLDDNVAVLAQTSFQIEPKCFQKVAMKLKLMEFSTDWLIN